MSIEQAPKVERKPSVQEALSYVQGKMAEAMTLGANDYEPGAFQQIIRALEQGQIEPQTAMEQANAIIGNKQDYH
jgi:hypothetical protein